MNKCQKNPITLPKRSPVYKGVAFLANLLFLPGIGTLMIGKKKAGYIQLLMVLISLVFIGIAISSILAWAGTVLVGVDVSSVAQEEIVLRVRDAYLTVPPCVLGFIPAVPILLIGNVLFLITWLLSLVSVCLVRTSSNESLEKLTSHTNA